MTKKKLTIADLQAAKKNSIQLTQMYADNAEDAAACEAAGIDIVCTLRENGEEIRKAAPNTFLVMAYCDSPAIACERDAISAAFVDMEKGADAIYSSLSPHLISAMTRERIPVVGHVGYVPYRQSWYGGARAVGKTADEAMWVYQHALEFQDAGVIGVELEIVPNRIADEISKRLDMLVISMGSGSGGDIQYVFATDVLGTTTGHVPRHAKQYADINREMKKVQQMRVDALTAFKNDVDSGAFPGPEQLIGVEDSELTTFVQMLKDKT